MSRAATFLKGLKITRRELRNFVLSTALLTGIFTAGVSAATAHSHHADICSMSKLVH